MALTARQERFCKEYLIDCNATQAAIRAGYCEKTAAQSAARLLRNVKISARIAELMAEKDAALIAKGDEVLKYLTQVLRGESESEIVVVEGCGDGMSSAVKVQKAPDEKERLKAAELLGKRYGLFTERIEVSDTPRIVDDIPDTPRNGVEPSG